MHVISKKIVNASAVVNFAWIETLSWFLGIRQRCLPGQFSCGDFNASIPVQNSG